MRWFLDVSTRGKLFAGFGAMTVFLAIVIAAAYLGITAIKESEKRLYEKDFANERDVLALRVNYNGMRLLMLEAQLLSNRAEQDPLLAEAADRSKRIDRIIRGLLERGKNDPKRLPQLEELKAVWQAFAQTKDAEIIPLILAGKTAESRELALGVQQGRAQHIRDIAEELGKASEDDARLAVDHAELQANESIRIFLFVGITALVIGVVLTQLMARVMAGPLRVLSGVADRIASGDLTADVPQVERADEVGALMRAFGVMLVNLRRVTREITQGVNVLASSSGEITASTAQVASGSAETATAVSETTSTVEEVKQTAQVAAQKAKYVSEAAQKTAQISQS
ncbi:MAG: methyl-accepting chemotaxis protein, partial [Betaproteobacteria bacterium]